MKKNYKCRVTIIMAILSLLFGCSGNKKYNAGDIIGASTSYYGTECDPVYAFSLQKQDENWLFPRAAMCRVRKGIHLSIHSLFRLKTLRDSLRSSGRKTRSAGSANTDR